MRFGLKKMLGGMAMAYIFRRMNRGNSHRGYDEPLETGRSRGSGGFLRRMLMSKLDPSRRHRW